MTPTSVLSSSASRTGSLISGSLQSDARSSWISGENDELVAPDARAWREWLRRNHDERAAVMLVLAKKGTTSPTTLTYDEALEEAMCFGWIDGQVRRRDEQTYFQ